MKKEILGFFVTKEEAEELGPDLSVFRSIAEIEDTFFLEDAGPDDEKIAFIRFEPAGEFTYIPPKEESGMLVPVKPKRSTKKRTTKKQTTKKTKNSK